MRRLPLPRLRASSARLRSLCGPTSSSSTSSAPALADGISVLPGHSVTVLVAVATCCGGRHTITSSKLTASDEVVRFGASNVSAVTNSGPSSSSTPASTKPSTHAFIDGRWLPASPRVWACWNGWATMLTLSMWQSLRLGCPPGVRSPLAHRLGAGHMVHLALEVQADELSSDRDVVGLHVASSTLSTSYRAADCRGNQPRSLRCAATRTTNVASHRSARLRPSCTKSSSSSAVGPDGVQLGRRRQVAPSRRR